MTLYVAKVGSRRFIQLGQTEIPAIIIEAEETDCLVMSLVENCARRQHRAIDLLQDISTLRGRGYSDREIAPKIGVSVEYIHMIGTLLKRVRNGLSPPLKQEFFRSTWRSRLQSRAMRTFSTPSHSLYGEEITRKEVSRGTQNYRAATAQRQTHT